MNHFRGEYEVLLVNCTCWDHNMHHLKACNDGKWHVNGEQCKTVRVTCNIWSEKLKLDLLFTNFHPSHFLMTSLYTLRACYFCFEIIMIFNTFYRKEWRRQPPLTKQIQSMMMTAMQKLGIPDQQASWQVVTTLPVPLWGIKSLVYLIMPGEQDIEPSILLQLLDISIVHWWSWRVDTWTFWSPSGPSLHGWCMSSICLIWDVEGITCAYPNEYLCRQVALCLPASW